MTSRKTASQVASSRVIGQTLKRWRKERGLTLRDVEMAARAHPEPIGFDYLSRLENGELMPSVPKLSSLAQVYERPISELVALYESVALRRNTPKGLDREEARSLGMSALAAGDFPKALACFQSLLDTALKAGTSGEDLALLYDELARALIGAGRYVPARQYLEEGLRSVETESSRTVLMRDLAAVHAALGDTILAEVLSRRAESTANAPNQRQTPER